MHQRIITDNMIITENCAFFNSLYEKSSISSYKISCPELARLTTLHFLFLGSAAYSDNESGNYKDNPQSGGGGGYLFI